MAWLGAFSGAFNNNAIRISQERKDGWIRQLRLTCLPANSYVVAKIIATVALTAPQIALMMLLGRFYGNIQLPIWQWTVIALTIWLGTLIFASLAVAIGYWMDPSTVQPVIMDIRVAFSLFGGLWFPVTGGLRTFAQGIPTFRIVQIATDVVTHGTVSWIPGGHHPDLAGGRSSGSRRTRSGTRRRRSEHGSGPAGTTRRRSAATQPRRAPWRDQPERQDLAGVPHRGLARLPRPSRSPACSATTTARSTSAAGLRSSPLSASPSC